MDLQFTTIYYNLLNFLNLPPCTAEQWFIKYSLCLFYKTWLYWVPMKKKTPKQKQPNPGVLEAIHAAGGQVQLAQIMQVTQPAIHDWLYRNIPAAKAKQIEDLVGIPRAHIRPDIFD